MSDMTHESEWRLCHWQLIFQEMGAEILSKLEAYDFSGRLILWLSHLSATLTNGAS